MDINCDVAIIGGGPAGSTVGTLLRKYNPRLNVRIFERESFPRDHVGESQLPLISQVLNEMGVWDKIEAAGFPVKIGATYRWGQTDDLWDFEFLPDGKFNSEPRPAKFQGQRVQTAFQVDRAKYDDILLNHAAELGCTVKQSTGVRGVGVDGRRITHLELSDGSRVVARHYVDASGHSGILRRSVGIQIDCPSTLQNIAIWDYWDNAEWAVSIGIEGTRVQVLSLPFGWIWFIPLGRKRTSIGLIVPAAYYKEQKLSVEDLYMSAVTSEPVLAPLIKPASREGNLTTTKDWSFVADCLADENWFLAGESAGFADPILAAGMTLAHMGARDTAYSILALDRKDYEPEWIKSNYSESHRWMIRQHIRFADFWYSANGVFSDLKEHAATIAQDAGLVLNPDDAWRWLGQGGFINRDSSTQFAQYGFLISKELVGTFTGGAPQFQIAGKTHFRINLEGAEKDWVADYEEGRIDRRRAYRRDGKLLPKRGITGWMIDNLAEERTAPQLAEIGVEYTRRFASPKGSGDLLWTEVIKTLEAMVSDGWITTRIDPNAQPMPEPTVDFSQILHAHR